MTEPLFLVRIGTGGRLERALDFALQGLPVRELEAAQRAENGTGRRLLFAVRVDAYGPDESFLRLLRLLRQKQHKLHRLLLQRFLLRLKLLMIAESCRISAILLIVPRAELMTLD